MFANRTQAGKLLAAKVLQYLNDKLPSEAPSDIVVAALPRGGVPVAVEIARLLGCKIDVIVAKKIPMPDQPEYAIGAASADEVTVLNPGIPMTPEWDAYIRTQTNELFERTKQGESNLYKAAGYRPSEFRNKTVIIVDDGIATGMTVYAAVLTARERCASSVIVAAPVVSPDAHAELSEICDGVIALSVPTGFYAVGQCYADFEQTQDAEVTRCMRASADFIARPAAS